MTTISIADKSRLTVLGVEHGKRYLVNKAGAGWWIEPAPETPVRVRQITRAQPALSEHLDALAQAVLVLAPEPNEQVPPCRF